jgi:hypothetical protein
MSKDMCTVVDRKDELIVKKVYKLDYPDVSAANFAELVNFCGICASSRSKATQPGGIGSLESILGLLKSLKIQV